MRLPQSVVALRPGDYIDDSDNGNNENLSLSFGDLENTLSTGAVRRFSCDSNQVIRGSNPIICDSNQVIRDSNPLICDSNQVTFSIGDRDRRPSFDEGANNNPDLGNEGDLSPDDSYIDEESLSSCASPDIPCHGIINPNYPGFHHLAPNLTDEPTIAVTSDWELSESDDSAVGGDSTNQKYAPELMNSPEIKINNIINNNNNNNNIDDAEKLCYDKRTEIFDGNVSLDQGIESDLETENNDNCRIITETEFTRAPSDVVGDLSGEIEREIDAKFSCNSLNDNSNLTKLADNMATVTLDRPLSNKMADAFLSNAKEPIDLVRLPIRPPNLDSQVQNQKYSLDSQVQNPKYSLDSQVQNPKYSLDSQVQNPKYSLDCQVQNPKYSLDCQVQNPKYSLDSQVQNPKYSLGSEKEAFSTRVLEKGDDSVVPRKKEKMQINYNVKRAGSGCGGSQQQTTARRDKRRTSPEPYGCFDVYNIETAMPVIDLDAIENHLRAAREEERRRRTDREEIRRRLAMGTDSEDYYDHRPLRKPSLQARLQSGMNLQICFMNENVSDVESPASDIETDNSKDMNMQVDDAITPVKPTHFKNHPYNSRPLSVNVNDNIPNQNKVHTRPGSLPLTPCLRQEPPVLTEADFFARQARLQVEARMALAQAKDMAHMQMEVERQKQRKSPITEVVRASLQKVGVPCPEQHRRVSRQMLTDMNHAQLQVIVNELHSQIEGLNEGLVGLLMARDELHMGQDSMLVDIEDLTRYLGAKEQCIKEQKTSSNNHPQPAQQPNRLLRIPGITRK